MVIVIINIIICHHQWLSSSLISIFITNCYHHQYYHLHHQWLSSSLISSSSSPTVIIYVIIFIIITVLLSICILLQFDMRIYIYIFFYFWYFFFKIHTCRCLFIMKWNTTRYWIKPLYVLFLSFGFPATTHSFIRSSATTSSRLGCPAPPSPSSPNQPASSLLSLPYPAPLVSQWMGPTLHCTYWPVWTRSLRARRQGWQSWRRTHRCKVSPRCTPKRTSV